jgi:thioredoxin-related protein
MRKQFLLFALILTTIAIISLNCGKDYKTPADIKDKVAWLDGKTSLPMFPFGTNPIYMFFHSFDCPISEKMLDEIFTRPEIIEYLNNNFTCISVVPDSFDTIKFLGEDVSRRKLLDAFRIEGYPAHFFFDAQGFLKGNHYGYIELRVFKQALKYVAEGYMDKYDLKTFRDLPEAQLDTVWGEF